MEVVQCEAAGVVVRQLGQAPAQRAADVLAALRAYRQQQRASAEGIVRGPLLGQAEDVLALVEHTHVQRDGLLRGQPEPRAQRRGLRGRHGAEALGVDAVGNVVRLGRRQSTGAKLEQQVLADGHTGVDASQHEAVHPAHDRARQALQVVAGQAGLDHRLQAHQPRQRPDEGIGEIRAVAVQHIEVTASAPDMPGQIEPEPELTVLAHAAGLEPVHGEALDLGAVAQAGPAIGDEFDVVVSPPQFLGQRQRLQRGAAVLGLEKGRVHQDAHRRPRSGGGRSHGGPGVTTSGWGWVRLSGSADAPATRRQGPPAARPGSPRRDHRP